MAAAIISRSFSISNSHHFSILKRLLQPHFFRSRPFSSSSLIHSNISESPFRFFRINPPFGVPFCSSFSTTSSPASANSETPANSTAKPPKRNTLVNFSMSDSEVDSESDSESKRESPIDKAKLPPPYDPFSKKPFTEEPEDPTNLQEVFHKIRGDGLMNSAAKMFDGLSKDGLTHEALELFSQIKDKGQMPEVVAHTAVMEAYINARQAKQGSKVFMRMLGSGVLPNAYTYSVLIRGLVSSGDLKLVKEAKKYALEMVEKRGIKPNAGICAGVYEGLANAGLPEEGKEMLQILKSKGVVPEEEKIREAVKDKRAHLNTVMNILYGK